MAQQGFSDFERAAMKERAKELREESNKKKNPQADLFEKIAEMPEKEAFIASSLHSLVEKTAPELHPKTWYGMPAYANDDGKVVFFFQPATKFKSRYNTLGFNDSANLDDGKIWPTSYALTVWNEEISNFVSMIIKKAISKN
ncbi:iron chaperone [Liquorilactobacillus oeni]|uniref:YdhG-like domain-containing protein n=1 Tax=Liquorilactobacillus oeni DSM 19972 TaxID=1423777 RepID=A0A0R1MEY9_9LACO|nr:hypothetical protein [Liquorilactobacillus oeni]KRL04468.1 hypothetical protein FD46_GL001598 [Liquorilactobacillus oeni DSM 19972]